MSVKSLANRLGELPDKLLVFGFDSTSFVAVPTSMFLSLYFPKRGLNYEPTMTSSDRYELSTSGDNYQEQLPTWITEYEKLGLKIF